MWGFAGRYTPSGGWETPALLDPADGAGTNTPQIVIDSGGNAIAVWGDNASIYANRYTVGSGWGDAKPIETSTSAAYVPQVAFDADGNAIAIWYQSQLDTSNNTYYYSILFNRFE